MLSVAEQSPSLPRRGPGLLRAALLGSVLFLAPSWMAAGGEPSGFETAQHIVTELTSHQAAATDADLSGMLRELQQAIQQAETQSADAMVRFATFAAWVVHRESKKTPSSLRLIQITRSTGRTEEVERYQRRHDLLQANIDAAAQQYTAAVQSLGQVSREISAKALKDFEAALIEQGMVENIRVCQMVTQHVQQFLDSGDAPTDAWKKDFENL